MEPNEAIEILRNHYEKGMHGADKAGEIADCIERLIKISNISDDLMSVYNEGHKDGFEQARDFLMLPLNI
jgi:hypothetical protein